MLACAVLAFATASLGQATGSASTARKTAADKQRERRLKVGREALELSALERADEREEWPNQIDASKPEGHCDGDCSDGRGRYVVAEEMGYTVYHGEFVDGQPAGMGLLRYADNTTLEGNWVDGACRGYCQWISAGGDVFEGELIDGIRAGYGELRSPAAGTLYRGDWSENQYSGPGELIIVLNSTTDAAAVFSGVFEAGDLNGFGSHTWEQQVTSGEQNYALHPEYRGHWEASKYSGRGELVWAPGVAQAGSWLAGHFVEEDTVKRSAAQIKIDVTEIYHAFNRSFESDSSRRRDCHSADPPPVIGVSIGMGRGCQQNDSLADGYPIPSMGRLHVLVCDRQIASGHCIVATLCACMTCVFLARYDVPRLIAKYDERLDDLMEAVRAEYDLAPVDVDEAALEVSPPPAALSLWRSFRKGEGVSAD